MTATTEGTDAETPAGTIRYWAAAKAAAGTAEEPYRATTLAEALEHARSRHDDRPRLARVLGYCSFLVDGRPVGGRDHASVLLAPGGTVEVLPPFAGG
ncbi:MoaD/ThiS family protein [Streptomyces sp. NPDC058254]|uniref:MoaD/ThiS family protein n=1 Tax=Streptomyces sp. NPDC058254 TaxID=3346406 RepID=UPI0036E70E45